MIRGIGADIEEVDRIRSRMESEAFLSRCFLPEEVAYAMSRPDPAQHLTARFCAKEAFAKACGSPQKWHEVRVVNGPAGAPSLALSGDAARALEGCRVHLTMSHTRRIAFAEVIIEEIS
ncbi:MAG: holo-ACP synthase [Abditibacteriota bacterium]|nr:holo-ACP synthase [Abditibacteriota bacterium]